MDLNRKQIVYSLNVQDIQTVAVQEEGRKLSNSEVAEILDSIAEKINWYDAIHEAINEKLELDGSH